MKDFVVRIVFRYVLLFIQVYAFYVIFHGHLSPGGGFAGGIILGLGMVLYILIFGVNLGSKRLPQHLAIILIGIGGTMEGIKFLLPVKEGHGPPGQLFSVGLISIMSLAIGLLVASALVTMFYLLVEEEGKP
jgi:multicomponent Na+:H+ antiporter subunit B